MNLRLKKNNVSYSETQKQEKEFLKKQKVDPLLKTFSEILAKFVNNCNGKYRYV